MLLRILLPFTYFATSRLKTKDWVFFLIYEIFINLLVVYFTKVNFVQSLLIFLLSYLGFISIYEIGYIFNDLVSTKYETSPRKRLGDYDPGWGTIIVLVIIRIVFFGLITYYLSQTHDMSLWFVFFIALSVVFGCHNIISSNHLKILTFLQLAIFRITSPLILLFSTKILLVAMLSYAIGYAFYRTIIYMESKDILLFEDRKSYRFIIGFYIITIPIFSFIAVLGKSYIPLIIVFYYLMVWVGFHVVKFLTFFLPKKQKGKYTLSPGN